MNIGYKYYDVNGEFRYYLFEIRTQNSRLYGARFFVKSFSLVGAKAIASMELPNEIVLYLDNYRESEAINTGYDIF